MRLSLRRTPAASTKPNWSQPRSLTDAELLTQLRRDDAHALQMVLERNWALVVDYVARLIGSTDAAEDIAQRTFCQLWDRRSQWRNAGSLRALLCKIARNYAISEHRRELADVRSALVFAELGAAETTAHEPLEREQLREALDREIGRLPARRREILVLRCVHDLSYKEIADVMNIAPQTVANQLSKALGTLRIELASALD